MTTYNNAEEKWLMANELLEDNKTAEAKRVLEELLEEEPGYGRAHNHLGWIHYYHFKDYKRGERHLKLAMEYAPDYVPGHWHYMHLLFELKRWDELVRHINETLKVPGINTASVYDYFANYYEFHLKYEDAVNYYEKAITLSINNWEIADLRNSVSRVLSKTSRAFKIRRAWRNFVKAFVL